MFLVFLLTIQYISMHIRYEDTRHYLPLLWIKHNYTLGLTLLFVPENVLTEREWGRLTRARLPEARTGCWRITRKFRNITNLFSPTSAPYSCWFGSDTVHFHGAEMLECAPWINSERGIHQLQGSPWVLLWGFLRVRRWRPCWRLIGLFVLFQQSALPQLFPF